MKTIIFIITMPLILFAAVNDTTVDSAVSKRIYMGNYNYNTCIASQPILTMRWASDVNRPVFKNRTGTLYKVLTDASTSSNTPQYRAFFADANGAASSSSSYTYTNGNLHAPYFTGDSVVVTGKIKGSVGELYAMNQNVRTTDSINALVNSATRVRTPLLISDSIDNSSGIKAQNIWAYNNTGSGSYVGIFKGQGALPGYPSLYVPVLKSDFPFIHIATNNKYTSKIGEEYFEVIDTSNASLYKFKITKDTTIGKIIKADSIKIGSGSFIKSDATLGTSFYDGINATDLRASDSVNGSYGSFSTLNTGFTQLKLSNAIPDTVRYLKLSRSEDDNWNYCIDAINTGTSIYYRFNSVEAGAGYNYLNFIGGKIGLGKTPTYTFDVLGDGGFTGGVNATDFRASDSVKASSIAATGRITGSSLQVTDSVKSNYATFSNIIANGDGVRFNCATEVNFLYKDSLNDNVIIGCKYSPGDGNVAGVVLSNSTLDSTLVIRTDTVKVKKLIATTSDVTSSRVNGSNVVTDSTGSINVDIYGFTSSPISTSFTYIKHGNQVTLRSNIALYETSNSGDFYIGTLPSFLTPSLTQLWVSAPAQAFYNNSADVTGGLSAKITNAGRIDFIKDGSWTASGNKGYRTFSITYPLN